jgi:hypothetical protein
MQDFGEPALTRPVDMAKVNLSDMNTITLGPDVFPMRSVGGVRNANGEMARVPKS